ncbi:hypothetical protein [Desertimonas flava]|uniref:hypothetical protein n=1 Tax=Desertimonas flava TaxID=2064846 RepID=UPI000E3540B0|nr:hypothetical protein [Desertimonas flava]
MKRRRVHTFVGDEVEMRCGLRGIVAAVERAVVTLELDHDVMVRIAPWAIAKVIRPALTEAGDGVLVAPRQTAAATPVTNPAPSAEEASDGA